MNFHASKRQIFKAFKSFIAALSLSALGAQPVAAQSWPDKPVRVLVPAPAGSSLDVIVRSMGETLKARWGQPLVVENKPGAGGTIGMDAVAKAAPDGYTLLVGSVSNMAINPGLYRNLPYDSLRDFEPVGLAVAYSYTLVARKDLPSNSLKELVAYAKANPRKLTYASGGNGSGQHVLAAALWQLAGVELVHVPYRGAQAAYQDLLGGRVELFFDLSPTARGQIDGGTLKALAVSGSNRLAFHPDVPTITETGVAALELESWFGLFAPAKVPAEALDRLRAETARIAQAPDVVDIFRKAGGKPLNLNATETRALVRRDVERWTKLTRDLDIKPE